MKKFILLLAGLACCFSLTVCEKKASPIVLPDPEKILSIDVTAGDVAHTWEEPQYIRSVIKRLTAAEPTRKQSVQDTPQKDEYAKIDFHHQPSGTSTLFVYADQGKYYVERPYQGIYEISRELYQSIIEGP